MTIRFLCRDKSLNSLIFYRVIQKMSKNTVFNICNNCVRPLFLLSNFLQLNRLRRVNLNWLSSSLREERCTELFCGKKSMVRREIPCLKRLNPLQFPFITCPLPLNTSVRHSSILLKSTILRSLRAIRPTSVGYCSRFILLFTIESKRIRAHRYSLHLKTS